MARLKLTTQEKAIIGICFVYAMSLFVLTIWLLIDGIGP